MLSLLCQSGNTGRRAAEMINELTDFGGLSDITGDAGLPPKVSQYF